MASTSADRESVGFIKGELIYESQKILIVN